MDNLKLDNTNSFGAAGYTINWVSSPKSTFGGIFKKEVALLESGLMDFRYVQLGDVKDAYNILESKLSDLSNIEFEDVMRYIAETVQEYFGDYSNVSDRLKNYPVEDEVKDFSLERGKASDLQGKNAAMCVERAMLSQNLLKYISEKLIGLESYFKETGIEIQGEEGKPKREAHAFNLVSYNGKYYIFDATIPKGTKDNLQPIVAELPEHVFTSLVESPRVGYAVELEHISALTGKKMHYTLDYRAKSKYKTNIQGLHGKEMSAQQPLREKIDRENNTKKNRLFSSISKIINKIKSAVQRKDVKMFPEGERKGERRIICQSKSKKYIFGKFKSFS